MHHLLTKPEFPRSSRYDADWVTSNQMGPNALWLMEWLCEKLRLEPGMRVLDLGCGKAMTSIFLAREFGARVWAADLWMSPDNNWTRVVEAGVEDLVCPIKAEAHTLPFAQGFFDVIVSIDAYQYFGTDELYVDYLSRFLRPGGQLGVVMVGLTHEWVGPPPEALTRPQSNGKVFWEPSCRSFKTADFWRGLWERTPLLSHVSADVQPDGWRHWRDFENAVALAGKGIFPSDAEAIEADAGRTLAFIRATGRRTGATGENLYDPNLGVLAGAE